MAPDIANFYELRCDNPVINGRPCWAQKVPNAMDLYILAQARKTDEEGFPHVETLLVEISEDGKLRGYGSEDQLGEIAIQKSKSGDSIRMIDWVDGSNVTWVQSTHQ